MEIAFFWQMAASWSKIQERKPHLKLNFIIRPIAQNELFFFNSFYGKGSWKLHFSGKRLRRGAKFQKGDPT